MNPFCAVVPKRFDLPLVKVVYAYELSGNGNIEK